MNTSLAILRIIVVGIAAIILLPFSFIADSVQGRRDYTLGSMFVDLWVILKDIWAFRLKA